MTGTVLVERDGHLAHLILNRPEVLNAIDNELAEELRRCLRDARGGSEVWAIVFRGAGERAFWPGRT